MFKHGLFAVIALLVLSNVQCWISPLILPSNVHKQTQNLPLSSASPLTMYPSYYSSSYSSSYYFKTSRTTMLYAESTGIETVDEIEMMVEERMENSGEIGQRGEGDFGQGGVVRSMGFGNCWLIVARCID